MEIFADTYENFEAEAKEIGAELIRNGDMTYARFDNRKVAEYDHVTGIVTIP